MLPAGAATRSRGVAAATFAGALLLSLALSAAPALADGGTDPGFPGSSIQVSVAPVHGGQPMQITVTGTNAPATGIGAGAPYKVDLFFVGSTQVSQPCSTSDLGEQGAALGNSGVSELTLTPLNAGVSGPFNLTFSTRPVAGSGPSMICAYDEDSVGDDAAWASTTFNVLPAVGRKTTTSTTPVKTKPPVKKSKPPAKKKPPVKKIKPPKLSKPGKPAALPGGAKAWSDAKLIPGTTLFTHALDAITIAYNLPPIYDPETAASAFMVGHKKQKREDGSKPFYVGLTVFAIGNNGQGVNRDGGGGIAAEFIPPAGVSVLHNSKYPIFWANVPIKHGHDLAPVRKRASWGPGTVPGGVMVERPGGKPFTYDTSVNDVEIFVPVQTTRRLGGVIQPSCPQINSVSPYLLSGDPFDAATYRTLESADEPAPCPRNTVGNSLQVLVTVADFGAPKLLVPWVPLFASAPKPTPPLPHHH